MNIQHRRNAFQALTRERDSFKIRYEASQEALREVMSELTECRNEHAILLRRLTKIRKPTKNQ